MSSPSFGARKRATVIAGIGAVSVLGTVLAGCSSGSDSAADAGPAQSGGTLRYGLSQAPTCADPAQAGSNQTVYVTRTVVDSLTDQNPDTGEITPWLAKSWEISPDAASFTFVLRDDATFSDGTPVTADSVKKTFDSVKNLGPNASLAKSYLSSYTGYRRRRCSHGEDQFLRTQCSVPAGNFDATARNPRRFHHRAGIRAALPRCSGDRLRTVRVHRLAAGQERQDRQACGIQLGVGRGRASGVRPTSTASTSRWSPNPVVAGRQRGLRPTRCGQRCASAGRARRSRAQADESSQGRTRV